MMEDILNKIIAYADIAHGDQMRKYTPERYIVHPVRVMNMCKRVTDDISILAAAILHDVLEDTPVTKVEVETFLKTLLKEKEVQKTIKLVVELTDVYVKKDYPRLNRRTRKSKELDRLIKTSPDSQTIKYADTIDNCTEIVKHDRDFARVFLYECRTNLRKMDRGNQELYREALSVVEGGIERLK